MTLYLATRQTTQIDADLPYRARVNYSDGTVRNIAVALDDNLELAMEEEQSTWVFSSDGDLVFSSEKQLVKGSS